MQGSKVHLSSAETELMQNAEIILTKNSVLQKIKMLLEDLQEKQLFFIAEKGLQSSDPFFISPKISRGENYQGLPFIILDHPRTASGENFFFCRAMFWWGHHFSSTLHLSGTYKKNYIDKIAQAFDLLQTHFIAVSDQQWEHHFGESNYKKIGSMSEREFINACEAFDHIKIAGRWPLHKWEAVPRILFDDWKRLLGICGLIA